MTIQHLGTQTHWNYFLAIEEDIQKLSRWIEFSHANEAVYSLELARLLMTTAAEADVVAKAFCKLVAPAIKASSINAYQNVLVAAAPTLPQAKVDMPRYGLTFHPWSNWKDKDSPPDWWQGNNKVKHHRAEHFKEANLKNVLNSAAGLLVLLLIYYSSEQRVISPAPQLYVPRSFAMPDEDGLLLSIPEGANFPWA